MVAMTDRLTPDPDLVNIVPGVTYVDAETYDWLTKWLEDDHVDYPELRALFAKPSPFTRDCE
jgi:hypothetical protein